jgi:hypothetical protein
MGAGGDAPLRIGAQACPVGITAIQQHGRTPTMHTATCPPRWRPAPASIVVALGLAVVLVLLPTTGQAMAGKNRVDVADVKAHAARADSAVTRAIRRIESREYARARTALDTATGHVRRANAQAVSLIGAPPTDPESDEPPGPPAVLAALRLDNRVSIRVAPLFDGMARTQLLGALGSVIHAAQARRVTTLDRVLGLPAEGSRDDYDDGLADTLPSYAREVIAFSHALETLSLTPEARSILTIAHDRAIAAEQRMEKAYGGGE